MKGGAAGGGYAQVVPMEDINLHFTGDFHAIEAANNLLAALIDNHIYWGNELGIDPRRVTWRRSMDMNDRALREIVISLGGVAQRLSRARTASTSSSASEVMAIFCLANDLDDLQRRLGNIIVGYTRDRSGTRRRTQGGGPMTALLKDALAPNLVQTLENNPAFIHGGPFANIAHGCNSVHGDDDGAEARRLRRDGSRLRRRSRRREVHRHQVPQGRPQARLRRAGGDDPRAEDARRRRQGRAQDGKSRRAREGHREPRAARRERAASSAYRSSSRSTASAPTRRPRSSWSDGLRARSASRPSWLRPLGRRRRGAAEAMAQGGRAPRSRRSPSSFKLLYPDDMPLWEKIEDDRAPRSTAPHDITADKKVSDQIHGASGRRLRPLPDLRRQDAVHLLDRSATSRARRRITSCRSARCASSAGAEFLVVISGEIMTMPGLPKVRAANEIKVAADGRISGLF